MGSRKVFDATIAGLDDMPQVRDAVLRWTAETGMSPDNQEAWEMAGPAFLAVRLIGGEIVELRKTLKSAATNLTAAAQTVREEKAAPRPNTLVLTDENTAPLAAEIVRKLSTADLGIERAIRATALLPQRTPSAAPLRTRWVWLAIFVAGFTIGVFLTLGAPRVPWHAVASQFISKGL